jgi:hypothetical protein
MEWLQSNWIWIVLGFAFLAMHMFGHGGHGGRGGKGGHGGGHNDPKSASKDGAERSSEQGPGHQH